MDVRVDASVCVKLRLSTDDVWNKVLGLATDRHGLSIDHLVELHITYTV